MREKGRREGRCEAKTKDVCDGEGKENGRDVNVRRGEWGGRYMALSTFLSLDAVAKQESS